MKAFEPIEPHSMLRAEQDAYALLGADMQWLSIWQPRYALMVTVAEEHLPNFDRAALAARARGTPVHLRGSGGGAVCLGPGTLIVSHLHTAASNDIEATYRRFSSVLIDALSGLGIVLAAEQVPHAYCDGRFDLAWRGRKVGGMAQRRRMHNGVAQILIHAVLSICREALRYPEEVKRFYADLGITRIADPRVATTLTECLPEDVPKNDLLDRCAAAIARQFGPMPSLATSDPPILQKSA